MATSKRKMVTDQKRQSQADKQRCDNSKAATLSSDNEQMYLLSHSTEQLHTYFDYFIRY
jgi:hypothetical protein